jgi:crotonobetaine/carnitine-CoA ligase
MPLTPGTVGAAITDARAERGDRPFLLFGDDTFTYADVQDRSARIANGLRTLGVTRGSHVALILPNCPEYLWSWFGAARIGAPVVPVNVALKGDGLAHILDHSDAETFVVHHDYLDRFANVRDRLPKLRRVVVVGRVAGADVSWEHVAASSPDDADDPAIEASDLMLVMYTSGTTGPPKGVVIPQGQILGGPLLLSLAGVTGDDVLSTCLPLFHANASIISVWGAFGLGTRIAVSPRFSASRFWDEIRRYGATEFHALGAMLPILYKQPPRPDDADNPCRIVVSAACPKEIWEPFEERFGVEIVEFYGTVEGGLTMAGPDAPVGSIGRPLPINEMKIVRDDDTECGPNEVGELVSRPVGGGRMVRYYKNEQATAEKTRGGWLRSGDLAFADTAGFLWFVDRKTDSMRRRGENISSYEVEQGLNEHSDILESAVYAVPSELGEDEVMAALVLQAGASFDPDAIITHCAARMAYFMVPRYLRVVDMLPKTETHRVQKGPLREAGITADTWDREAAGHVLRH